MGRPAATGQVVPLRSSAPTAYDPYLPPQERRTALLAALPPTLQAVVTAGVEQRAWFDDAAGFAGMREVWTPPGIVDRSIVAAASKALAEIEREILAPADPGWLLARVLALLAHSPSPRSGPLDPAVEEMIALDWADDLGEFPRWAVDQAARTWRRTRKWRPTIVELRTLCEEAVAVERDLVNRLHQIAAAPSEEGRGGGRDLREVAARAIRRM